MPEQWRRLLQFRGSPRPTNSSGYGEIADIPGNRAYKWELNRNTNSTCRPCNRSPTCKIPFFLLSHLYRKDYPFLQDLPRPEYQDTGYASSKNQMQAGRYQLYSKYPLTDIYRTSCRHICKADMLNPSL